MVQKILTLQEANGILPLVKEHLFNVHLWLISIQRTKLEKEIALNKWLINSRNKSIKLKKTKNNLEKEKFDLRIKELELDLILEFNILMGFGAIIKNVFPAHIDFLSMKNGQLVCLCWDGVENEITHWHYLDELHFPRQAIRQKESFGPCVVH